MDQDAPHLTRLESLLMELIPDGSEAIGNGKLMKQFIEHASENEWVADEGIFEMTKQKLLDRNLIIKGRGRGGSVKRASSEGVEGFGLEAQAPPPAPASKKSTKKKGAKAKTATRKSATDEADIIAYRHADKRKNNPEVGMVNDRTDPAEDETRWCYDPHIDPALQFDFGRAQVEKLIDDALASGDEETMRAALEELKRYSAPYLNWTGKAERTSFVVDTVSLHVHERVDPATILEGIRKKFSVVSSQFSGGKGTQKTKNSKPKTPKQLDLFAAPFENLSLRDAIDFYHHEKGWSNRLIAGDSLQVMNSLLQKEGMAGQVQMIYIDPPYGIKYGSNFQPFVNKRDVKDRKDEDLTQEPEMIKAFRDTWELGIHSYLTYLRDRLVLSRELLVSSGSVFVQISDENLHHVRELMDEVFGVRNFVGLIAYSTTGGFSSSVISRTGDYIVWYGKDTTQTKFNRLFLEKDILDEAKGSYDQVEVSNGCRRPMSSDEKLNPQQLPELARPFTDDNPTSQGEGAATQTWNFKEQSFHPGAGNHWKAPVPAGMRRLSRANRFLITPKGKLRYVRYFEDFNQKPVTNAWFDIAGAVQDRADPKVYVVQTSNKIIERCLLMTTDPGDLVLDPTCGSGTTAFVAEKWGRRWITCDTSRVAVTLAKQRLMTASYDYYALRYPHEGLKGGFIYKTVPHVTLKSIANNPDIDEIYERLHPAMDIGLGTLNLALKATKPEPYTVREGARKGESIDFAKGDELLEWEVPFDYPDDWPDEPLAKKSFETFHAARQGMQQRMDDSIAAHADQETLYDQPEVEKSKLRITGPFSVEAVPFPTVSSLEFLVSGEESRPKAPPETENLQLTTAHARSGESARQHQWRDELLKTGVRGRGGQILKFTDLEPLPDTQYLHAIGELMVNEDAGSKHSGEEERDQKLKTKNQKLKDNTRVVVSFGPEHAALEQRQVELALREAGELFPLPKMIIYCAFTFDPEAAKDIDQLKGITALKAQMNTDLLTEDLKKGRASNQSFWLMGQPDVEVLSCEFLVFSDKPRGDGNEQWWICPFQWFKELSGLGGLEQVHGLGGEDLFFYALLSQGGDVWDHLANAQGWDLHSGEYRRRAGKRDQAGLPAFSWNCPGFAGRTGDLDHALRTAGLPELSKFRDVVARLRRDPETPGRLEKIANETGFPPQQLKTKNYQLKTLHQVEVHGFDYFNIKTGELVSGGKNKIAMWSLDTDYDERSLYPQQVFFPMAGAKDGWHKLKKNIRAELNEELLGQFHGTVSLPFEAGDNRKIAVKIVDDRGIESLKVVGLD